MNWEVRIEADGFVPSIYIVEAPKYGEAKIVAINKFMEDNNIIGTPNQFIKNNVLSINVRNQKDCRKERLEHPPEFYLEQVERLRRFIRLSKLPVDTKKKTTSLLLKVRKELSGTATVNTSN